MHPGCRNRRRCHMRTRPNDKRWVVDDGLDFLELSIVSNPGDAADEQEKLSDFVARKAVPVDENPISRTRRMLDRLIARSSICR